MLSRVPNGPGRATGWRAATGFDAAQSQALTCQAAIAVAGAAALSLSLLLAGPVLYVGKLVL